MNALPFPLNPSMGQRFGNWVWNGGRWVSSAASGVQIVVQTFQTVGQSPYQPSPGLVSATIECQGGGGAGGAAQGALVAGTGMENWMCAGGGGAAGCFSRITIPAALVLGGVIVNVGAGGVPASAFTQNTKGGDGGISSFGAFCLANGGGGGWSNVYTGGQLDPGFGLGGQRGTGTDTTPGIGDIAAWGNAGSSGNTFFFNATDTGGAVIWGGAGGGSHFQSGPPQSHQNPNGVPGLGGLMGAGGAGGASGYAAGPALGGAGGAGLVIVTEYCWADSGDDSCGVEPSLNVNARVAIAHEEWGGGRPHKPGWRPHGGEAIEGEFDD